MNADLEALEQKVAQLIVLCQKLGSENIALKQELAQSQSDVQQMREQVAKASARLEILIDKLPQDVAS
jgi:cell division protein ZapB